MMVGPPAEVVPRDPSAGEIEPPTPEPSPATVRHIRHNYQQSDYHHRSRQKSRNHISIPAAPPVVPKRHNSDLSLSTIAEESSFTSQASNGNYGQRHQDMYQQNAASVFVEPHVVVETTTYPSSNSLNVRFFMIFNSARKKDL